ncbi:hypothetical protein EDD21DRAFT_428048 [Dissophora ornata]|nr:hypothetical protein EDD21DRAFT_428048 [Dissophora ornata]
MSQLDTMPSDVFAAMCSENDGTGTYSPFQQHNLLDSPFDISALTPASSSQLSSSPMDLSNCDQDQFHTPSPSQLIPSPSLDLAGCNQDPFDRQLFSALLSPANTLSPVDSSSSSSSSSDNLLSESLFQLKSPKVEPLFQSRNQSLSLSLSLSSSSSSSPPLSSLTQDLEMTDATLEMKQEPTSVKKSGTDKEKTATIEKKTLSKPPGTAKRHSVSRQAQQPPLVTHQHHTPPPFVSPLIQHPHHQYQQHHQQHHQHQHHNRHHHHHHHHQHEHHKTGSLDLSGTSLGRFLQQQSTQIQQQQQQQQNTQIQQQQQQHGHIPSVGLVTMQMQGITSNLCSINSLPIQGAEQQELHQQQQQLQQQQQQHQQQQQTLFSQQPQTLQSQPMPQPLDLQQQFLQQSSMQCTVNAVNSSTIGPQRTQSGLKRRSTKDKLSKIDREEVWPTDVEKVFYEGK